MEKDRMNVALKLIIDIIRNDPLIENDVIIAEYQILRYLIRLLTNADEVDLIDKGSSVQCCCSCMAGGTCKIYCIDDIFGKIGGQEYNFEISFPHIINILNRFIMSPETARIE